MRKDPGFGLAYNWDWDATEREINQAIALAPSYICAHEDRAEYLSSRGRRSEAEAEVAKSLELDSSVSSALTESGGDQDATTALAHAGVGRRAETQKILRDLEQKSTKVYVSPYLIATLHAALGGKDAAFKLLEKAYLEKSLDISWYLKADCE